MPTVQIEVEYDENDTDSSYDNVDYCYESVNIDVNVDVDVDNDKENRENDAVTMQLTNPIFISKPLNLFSPGMGLDYGKEGDGNISMRMQTPSMQTPSEGQQSGGQRVKSSNRSVLKVYMANQV